MSKLFRFFTKKDEKLLKASAARWAAKYSLDEQRVVDYLLKVMPDIGAGDDPIGFLIASHAAIHHSNAALRKTIRNNAGDTHAVDEPAVH